MDKARVWADLPVFVADMQLFAVVLLLTWKMCTIWPEGNGFILFKKPKIAHLPQKVTLSICYEKTTNPPKKNCKSAETNCDILNSNSNIGGCAPLPSLVPLLLFTLSLFVPVTGSPIVSTSSAVAPIGMKLYEPSVYGWDFHFDLKRERNVTFIASFTALLRVLNTSTVKTCFIVTVHQRRCGKVMFSQVSCHSVVGGDRGPVWPLPMNHWNLLDRASPVPAPPPRDMRHGDPPTSPSPDMRHVEPPSPCWWHLGAIIGELFTQTIHWTSLYSLPPPPPHTHHCWHRVATYGWQAGVTHPTGMHSCFT